MKGITELSISHFKSIKDLSIQPNRINLFIGEPNSGKSNILEAISMLSINAPENGFKNVVRYKTLNNLFFDSSLDHPIEIKTNDLKLSIGLGKNKDGALLNSFQFIFYELDEVLNLFKNANLDWNFFWQSNKNYNWKETTLAYLNLDYNGLILSNNSSQLDSSIVTYIYKRLEQFNTTFRNFLNPPFGDNIPNLLISNTEYKRLVSLFFKDKGYKINLKPQDNELEIVKEVDDIIYSYPYTTISETLQRVVFLLMAIETNKNKSIILDEPESNTFPFYTKYIAERIAQDPSNQYFITTHNPYLLLNIIEKSPGHELRVFLTEMENYTTTVRSLTTLEIAEIIEMQQDAFLNFDKFTT